MCSLLRKDLRNLCAKLSQALRKTIVYARVCVLNRGAGEGLAKAVRRVCACEEFAQLFAKLKVSTKASTNITIL